MKIRIKYKRLRGKKYRHRQPTIKLTSLPANQDRKKEIERQIITNLNTTN